MRLVLPAARAELVHLDTVWGRLLVLGRGVVLFLALGALERDHFARHYKLQDLMI